LAGIADGEVLGEGRATPGTEEGLGSMVLKEGFPSGGIGKG
jgi:hypothetical protein